MNVSSKIWLGVLVSSLVYGCSGANDESSNAELESEKSPCVVAMDRFNLRVTECIPSTGDTLTKEELEDPSRGITQSLVVGMADCAEEVSCSVLQSVLSSHGDQLAKDEYFGCVGNYAIVEPPFCHELAQAKAEPSGEEEEQDGYLRSSDPKCKSGRSVCDYRIAKEREHCSDCRTQCASTFGSSCDVSRYCSNSCYRVDCDEEDLTWCSDFLENL